MSLQWSSFVKTRQSHKVGGGLSVFRESPDGRTERIGERPSLEGRKRNVDHKWRDGIHKYVRKFQRKVRDKSVRETPTFNFYRFLGRVWSNSYECPLRCLTCSNLTSEGAFNSRSSNHERTPMRDNFYIYKIFEISITLLCLFPSLSTPRSILRSWKIETPERSGQRGRHFISLIVMMEYFRNVPNLLRYVRLMSWVVCYSNCYNRL